MKVGENFGIMSIPLRHAAIDMTTSQLVASQIAAMTTILSAQNLFIV